MASKKRGKKPSKRQLDAVADTVYGAGRAEADAGVDATSDDDTTANPAAAVEAAARKAAAWRRRADAAEAAEEARVPAHSLDVLHRTLDAIAAAAAAQQSRAAAGGRKQAGGKGGGEATARARAAAVRKRSGDTTTEDDGVVRCPRHQEKAKLCKVKKDGPNKGRRFYACGLPRDVQCDFFLWAEDSQRDLALAITSETAGGWRSRQLCLWKQRLDKRSVKELKDMARKYGLPVGGKRSVRVVFSSWPAPSLFPPLTRSLACVCACAGDHRETHGQSRGRPS